MTIEELQSLVNKLQDKIDMAEKELDIFRRILKGHTHSGLETSGRLEPKTLLVGSFSPASILVGNGASGSFTSSNIPVKTITVVSGIITSIT